ncbi:MAG: cytochrome P450 [Rhodococcus sp. (in: high G+C Gram-positive bacteria)]|nr:MAG: cytochrome P450 [Rhodococcus sp. (in: high G+C Gram-positive bacteria)]
MTTGSDHALNIPAQCPVSHEFNPFGGSYQEDPAGSLRKARHEQPVFYSPLLDYYVVTRYADIKAIFRDTTSFSAALTLEPITPLREPAIQKLVEHQFDLGPFLVNEDEPIHMRRRRALAEPLSPANVRAWDPYIRDLVTSYIDKFVKKGHADLVAELMWEFPATVALKFMGVPDTEIEQARQFAVGQIMFGFGRPTEEEQIAGCDGMGRYFNHAKNLVAKLKENTDVDGWVPFAIRASQQDPDTIDDRFLVSMMMSGTSAAHETTSNAGANALLTLMRNRGMWDEICEEPSLIPNAVEECLRYSASVVAWRRLCVKSTSIAGVEIPEGAKVLVVTASGSFDDEIFDEPERFDIHRSNAKQHFAFGFGTHTCLGAPLARLEMKIVLEEMSRRLPHIRLVPDQEFEYLPNTSFRGPQNLFVEWDPADNPLPSDRP